MLKRLSLVAAVVLLPAFLWAAAGTATLTQVHHTGVKKIVWAWTSGDAAEGGTVTKATTVAFDGKLIGLTTDPGATAPTDNYDIAILDAQSHDVLLGAGQNRDTATTEHVAEASLGAVAGSILTLSITAAGDAKEGVVILYVR